MGWPQNVDVKSNRFRRQFGISVRKPTATYISQRGNPGFRLSPQRGSAPALFRIPRHQPVHIGRESGTGVGVGVGVVNIARASGVALLPPGIGILKYPHGQLSRGTLGRRRIGLTSLRSLNQINAARPGVCRCALATKTSASGQTRRLKARNKQVNELLRDRSERRNVKQANPKENLETQARLATKDTSPLASMASPTWTFQLVSVAVLSACRSKSDQDSEVRILAYRQRREVKIGP